MKNVIALMSQTKLFFWLIQAPNTSMQIFRNIAATIKASQKTAYYKVFYLGQKDHFFLQKMVAPSNKSYSHKS